jgi:hypothetical protein
MKSPIFALLCAALLTGDVDQDERLLVAAGATVDRDKDRVGQPITSVTFPHDAPIPSEVAITILKRQPQLEDLFLVSTNIGDETLAAVSSLPLELLSLQYSRVTDIGLKRLQELPKLRNLILADTAGTDAGLAEVGKCKSLERLALHRTNIGDAGCKNLKKLSRLWMLDLKDTQITDACLSDLSELPSLRGLSLRDTRITDSGLREMPKFAQLQYLYLQGAQIGDAGIRHLVGNPFLKKLELANTRVTAAGVEELRKSLPRCSITR